MAAFFFLVCKIPLLLCKFFITIFLRCHDSLQKNAVLARLFLQVNGLTDTKELQQVILEAMGVISDTIDAKAPLAYQTYPEIAKSICDALQKEDVEPDEELAGQQLFVLFESVIGRKNFLISRSFR